MWYCAARVQYEYANLCQIELQILYILTKRVNKTNRDVKIGVVGGGGSFQFFSCIETKRVDKKYTKRESNFIEMNKRRVNEPRVQKQELVCRHFRLLFPQEPCLDRRVTCNLHIAETLIRTGGNSS